MAEETKHCARDGQDIEMDMSHDFQHLALHARNTKSPLNFLDLPLVLVRDVFRQVVHYHVEYHHDDLAFITLLRLREVNSTCPFPSIIVDLTHPAKNSSKARSRTSLAAGYTTGTQGTGKRVYTTHPATS
jgi:hypothetical protein